MHSCACILKRHYSFPFSLYITAAPTDILLVFFFLFSYFCSGYLVAGIYIVVQSYSSHYVYQFIYNQSKIITSDTPIMATLNPRNDALTLNPNRFYYPLASDINITTRGSDWYWTVAAIMAFSSAVFMGLSFRVHRTKRIFHYITAAITLVAAIAYFTMASNLGYAAVQVEFNRPDSPRVAGQYREIFYVRYIDWVITTPVGFFTLCFLLCMHIYVLYKHFNPI